MWPFMANERQIANQESQARGDGSRMPQMNARDMYTAGIVRAIRAGKITFARELDSPFGPLDGYTHFSKGIGRDAYAGCLTEYNTRPLGAVVKDIIAMQATMAQVVFLESGCGMGVGAYDAVELGKRQPHPVVVDCVGLTPINPYLQIDDAMELLTNPYSAVTAPPVMNCDPFVRMQYIGSFPEDFKEPCNLPKNEYTLIHDNRGPCTHEARGNGSAVANNYRRLLTEDGILMVSDPTAVRGFSGFERASGDMRFRFTPQVGSTQKHFAILARAESVLAKAARKKLPSASHDEIIGPEQLSKVIASALESPHS